jgi:predicted nucleic acid-binding protein
MYLLDTSYLIDLAREKRARGGPATELLENLPAAGVSYISTVSMAQFSVGEHLASTAAARRRNAEFREWLSAVCHVLPFALSHAAEFGRIAAGMRRMGALIPESDIQIAATALAEGLTLVTADRKHFASVRGLKILSY